VPTTTVWREVPTTTWPAPVVTGRAGESCPRRPGACDDRKRDAHACDDRLGVATDAGKGGPRRPDACDDGQEGVTDAGGNRALAMTGREARDMLATTWGLQ
jgi:hypothetical protein